jgi:hypothetical protein
VLAGDGDGEELVAAGAGELVSDGDGDELADGDELVVAGAGDGDDGRHRRWWLCGLQWARAPAAETSTSPEKLCAAMATGMAKPVSRAATITARTGIGLMKPRP